MAAKIRSARAERAVYINLGNVFVDCVHFLVSIKE